MDNKVDLSNVRDLIVQVCWTSPKNISRMNRRDQAEFINKNRNAIIELPKTIYSCSEHVVETYNKASRRKRNNSGKLIVKPQPNCETNNLLYLLENNGYRLAEIKYIDSLDQHCGAPSTSGAYFTKTRYVYSKNTNLHNKFSEPCLLAQSRLLENYYWRVRVWRNPNDFVSINIEFPQCKENIGQPYTKILGIDGTIEFVPLKQQLKHNQLQAVNF